MENMQPYPSKIIQIFHGTHGHGQKFYGLDDKGNVWFCTHEPNGNHHWRISIPNDKPRDTDENKYL